MLSNKFRYVYEQAPNLPYTLIFVNMAGIEGYNWQGDELQRSLKSTTDSELEFAFPKCYTLQITLMTKETI